MRLGKDDIEIPQVLRAREETVPLFWRRQCHTTTAAAGNR